MLFDKDKIENVNNKEKIARGSHVLMTNKARSRSLPKTPRHSTVTEVSRNLANPLVKVNPSLSQSMNGLSRRGIDKQWKIASVEIPVIVEDVTKWISGVNERTSCQDIIRVVLERESSNFKVEQ